MTKCPDILKSVGADHVGYPFRSVTLIQGEGLDLKITDKFLYLNEQIPGYEFMILVGKEEAGRITVIMEPDFEKVREEGHVGVELIRSFQGRLIGAKALMALGPLFREHAIDSILITCDEGNEAVRKNCESVNAKFLDAIVSGKCGTNKTRYILKF
jgi:predicted acetyltransferase